MCGNYSTATVASEIQADLDQLGVEQVDLMLLHWPCATMDETVATYKQMESMLTQKKARAIGGQWPSKISYTRAMGDLLSFLSFKLQCLAAGSVA